MATPENISHDLRPDGTSRLERMKASLESLKKDTAEIAQGSAYIADAVKDMLGADNVPKDKDGNPLTVTEFNQEQGILAAVGKNHQLIMQGVPAVREEMAKTADHLSAQYAMHVQKVKLAAHDARVQAAAEALEAGEAVEQPQAEVEAEPQPVAAPVAPAAAPAGAPADDEDLGADF